MTLGPVASKPFRRYTTIVLEIPANWRVHKSVALRIEFTHMDYIDDGRWGRSVLGHNDLIQNCSHFSRSDNRWRGSLQRYLHYEGLQDGYWNR